MPSNIIDFARRGGTCDVTPASAPSLCAKVVKLKDWPNRARVKRTPNGVFFTTRVLVTPGDIA